MNPFLATRTSIEPRESTSCSPLDAALQRLQQHLAISHGAYGIVEGLSVEGVSSASAMNSVTRRRDSVPPRGSLRAIHVSAGSAIDSTGRWVTIPAPGVRLDLPQGSPDSAWILVALYSECHPDRAELRWVRQQDALPPGEALGLVSWNGSQLDSAPRRPFRRPAARCNPRLAAGIVPSGSVTAIWELGDRPDTWRATIDTSGSGLQGTVQHQALPVVDTKAGVPTAVMGEVNWHIKGSTPSGFTLEVHGWPLEQAAIPTAWHWFAIEQREPPLDGVRSASLSETARMPAPLKTATFPERPSVATGAPTSAADTERVLDYIEQLHAWHNLQLHPWGILDGLSVGRLDTAKELRVAPGSAIDAQGREFVLSEPRTVSVPFVDGTGERLLVVCRDRRTQLGKANLAWRNPAAAAGDEVFRPETDLLLSRVVVRRGQVVSLHTEERRQARQQLTPNQIAGSTPDGRTEWRLWAPRPNLAWCGVATRIEFGLQAAPFSRTPAVFANVVGERLVRGRFLSGATIAADATPQGFDAIVLFSKTVAEWEGISRAELDTLLEHLKHVARWHVAWTAVAT